MQPNTALGLLLSAITLIFLQKISKNKPSKTQILFTTMSSIAIVLFGAATLAEYIFSVNFGIDDILGIASDVGTPFPGRPSPQAAINFALLGFALLSFHWPRIPAYLRQICVLLSGINSVLVATSYIFESTQFNIFPFPVNTIGMAIHTSLSFVLLTASVLLSQPNEGFMALVTSDTRSGSIARRVLLSSIIVPPIVGALTRIGVASGLYDVSAQVSLFVVIIVGLILRVTWKSAQQAAEAELGARDALAEQQFLADISTALSSSLNYETTLDNIVRLVVRDLADFCVIYVVENNGEIKRAKALCHDPHKSWICDLLTRIPINRKQNFIPKEVIEKKQTFIFEHLDSDILPTIALNDEHLRLLRIMDPKSCILVPLIVYGRLLGVLSLISSTPSRIYKQSDIQIVQEIAHRAAIAMENSQLYRESQRAKRVTDNVPAMLAYWDKNQICQFANRAYIDWFNVTPEQLVGHKTLLDLMGEELYKKNSPYIEGVLKGIPQFFERDLKYHPTGEIRHTSAIYRPEIVDGEVLGFFVLVSDVTDLKEAQLTALSEKERALKAIRIREDILAIVSHDLKNPLTSITMASQLLQQSDRLNSEQIQDLALRIQRSAHQMQRLIEDLLDFAKIEAGTFSIERHPEHPSELILSAVENIKILADTKKQTFKIEIDPDLRDVDCDAGRIHQVLSNLLSNAIKFTQENGIIRLIAKNCPEGVLISVIDTGPGIPPQHLKKVFARFWQAESTKHLGSGLGLSIAKGIVEAHGSRIWVESALGQGSRFSFIIPFTDSQERPYISPSPAEHERPLEIV